MGQSLLLALMFTQWSGDTLHKQVAFRYHQQSSLDIVSPLASTLTLVIASHRRKISTEVQIFNLILFARVGY